MDVFKRDEAFLFIEKFLEVDNAQARFRTDRVGLLDDIAFKLSTRIPFQNVSLMALEPEERVPSLSKMKEMFTSGVGGLCFDINPMVFFLLSAIGFDVCLARATVTITVGCPDHHVAVIVNNVQQNGDQFLIDAATGNPMFQAVNLNFSSESSIFKNAHLEYKFIRFENKLLRMHRKGDVQAMKGNPGCSSRLEFWVGDWRRFLYVDLDRVSKDYFDFQKQHLRVYQDPSCSSFLTSHRVICFPEGRAAIVVNEKTLIQNDEGDLEVKVIEGGDEGIKKAIQRICPKMSDALLEKSLRNWRKTQQSE